jgi:hypothetical protein
MGANGEVDQFGSVTMFDAKGFENRMTEERLKAQLIALQSQCEAIAGRFDHLDREPTPLERDTRRADFLAARKRLGELDNQLLGLACRKLR